MVRLLWSQSRELAKSDGPKVSIYLFGWLAGRFNNSTTIFIPLSCIPILVGSLIIWQASPSFSPSSICKLTAIRARRPGSTAGFLSLATTSYRASEHRKSTSSRTGVRTDDPLTAVTSFSSRWAQTMSLAAPRGPLLPALSSSVTT